MTPKTALTEALWLALLAAIPALIAFGFHPKAPSWQATIDIGELITAEESRRVRDRAIWIDLRATSAFAAGAIPEAISLDPAEWDAKLSTVRAKWRAGRIVILYCQSVECDANRAFALRLNSEVGCENIRILKGGYEAWLAHRR